MFSEEFKKEIFRLAKLKGFSDFELFYESSKSLSISTFEGEIEEFSENKIGGINFRGIYNGKLGSSFSEYIDENTAEYLVSNAKMIAEVSEDEDEIIFHDGTGDYVDLKLYHDEIDEISIEEKIEYVLDLDRKAHELKDIDKVLYIAYSDSNYTSRIVNSLGLDKSVNSNFIFGVAGISASDDENNYTEYESKISNSLEELKSYDILGIASKNLSKKLYSKPIESGKYRTIFKNEAFSSLLSVFMGAFSARNCQKGFSKLAGKIGEKIAATCVNIIDDPHIENANGSSGFDAEGVATFKKTLVEDGVLKSYLHNLVTAKKDGVKSTGNASRGFKSLVGISPSNCFIDSGSTSYRELLEILEDGIIITELEGLHAGVDTLSGDLSLKCAGFIQKNGILEPINQVVVTDNFFDLLKNIEVVANDLDIIKRRISSPSVYVGEVSISGL